MSALKRQHLIKIFVCFTLFTGWASLSYAQFNKNYYQQGRFEFSQKNYTEAIRLLSYAIEMDHDQPDAWFYRGVSKYYNGDYIGAEADFSSCLQRNAYHKNALVYRAIVRNRDMNFQQAFHDFEAALQLDPEDAFIYFQRATAHLYLSQFQACISDCNKAIKYDIGELAVFTIRGMAYSGMEVYDSAMMDFDFVLKNDEDLHFTRVQKGQTYQKMNKVDSALMCYNQVLEKDSSHNLALYRRALLHFENENFQLALKDVNQTLTNNPENQSARFTRAVIYSQLDKIPLAIADYTEILKKHPDNILTWYNRAGLYATTEQWEQAENDYSKAITLFPDYSDAYRNRSIVRMKMGKPDASKRDQFMANSVSQMNELKSESLKHQQSMKLQKLTSLDSNFSNAEDDILKTNIQTEKPFVFIPENMHVTKAFDDGSDNKSYQLSTFALSNQFANITATELQKAIDSISIILDKEVTAINLIRRGSLHSIQNNFNKALADFEMAEQIDDQNPLLHFCKGSTYLLLGQFLDKLDVESSSIATLYSDQDEVSQLENSNPNFQKAIESFNQSIKLDESFGFAYYNRAYTHGLMGNHRAAISDYGKSTKYRKKFTEAYYNRGLTFIYTGQNTYGCEDMGKAGELGKIDAYTVIKIYCN